MKNKIIKTAALAAAFILQLGPAQSVGVMGFKLNLCVLAFVAVCFFSPAAEAAVFGGIFGLALDGAVGRVFGVQLLLYLYLALGVKLLASEKINNSPALMAVYIGMFTFLYYAAYGIFSLAVLRGSVSVGRWLLTAMVTAALNLAAALPIMWAVYRLQRREAAG